MSWIFFKDRFLPNPTGGTVPFTLPTVILEIQADFVAGASLDPRAGLSRRMKRMGVAELQSPALVPLPSGANIGNAAELRRAVRAITDVVGNGTGRFGLLLPDGTVRVSILSFETLPEHRREAEALVRWRMRESLPFAPEEARLSYQVSWREPGLVEVLAVAARSAVLAEYEQALEQMSGGPILILPATIALLPLLPERYERGQLLVHVCSGLVTTAVVVGSRLRFWRTRDLGRTSPEEMSKGVAAEAARTLASSRDHLNLEMGRVWLCARPPAAPEMAAELARAVSQEVELLVPGANFAATLPVPEQALYERYGATIAGLISNAGFES